MKNDAVSMRPTETMTTGLEIGFAACHTNHKKRIPGARVSTLTSRETLDPKQKRGGVRLLTIPPDLLVVACAGDPAAASTN
jgi:hypothetical protein